MAATQAADNTPAAADHLVLPTPLPTTGAAGTVEVVEVFWYGCPHCFRLESQLRRWIARQPADVRIRRLPAVLTESWRPAARLHYTLESLGRLDSLHAAVFEAEHEKRSLQVQSRDVDVFAEWAEKQGVPRPAFVEAWNSPAVAARVDEAARLTLPLKRIGVPAIIVDGHLLTTASLTGSHDALLDTADRLIAQVRSERASNNAAKQ
jgi:thiol:disulfide interchange protein DsbA